MASRPTAASTPGATSCATRTAPVASTGNNRFAERVPRRVSRAAARGRPRRRAHLQPCRLHRRAVPRRPTGPATRTSTWEAYRASIIAGITAGASGIFFWGWDLAGFSGEIPDAELYLRSAAMAAFCPIMQYHSEFNHHRVPSRDRTPWNIAERTGDPRVLPTYRAFARLREALVPYLGGGRPASGRGAGAVDARRSGSTGRTTRGLGAPVPVPAGRRSAGRAGGRARGDDVAGVPARPATWVDAWTGETPRGRARGGARRCRSDRIPLFRRGERRPDRAPGRIREARSRAPPAQRPSDPGSRAPRSRPTGCWR